MVPDNEWCPVIAAVLYKLTRGIWMYTVGPREVQGNVRVYVVPVLTWILTAAELDTF